MKYRNSKKGFTLTELLIGLSIGIVVLTGLMSFYFRSSKMIGAQQTMVKDLSQLQFVMNKIVQDIKEANTVVPGTGTTVTPSQWDSLPNLCYERIWDNNSICQPPSSSYPKPIPLYPAASPYEWQYNQFATDTGNGWFPKDQPSGTKESNQLVFYKVINNKVTRVIYYFDKDPSFPDVAPMVYRLRRKQQTGIVSTSTSLNDTSLTTTDIVILSNLNYVQFTYPILIKKLSLPGDTEYDASQIDNDLYSQILSLDPDGDKPKLAYMQSSLMNKYRNIINIKIATAGPQIGNKRVNGLELSTEVNVRN